MERISRSWGLVKASWSVLRADKELIVYPVVSIVLTVLVMAVFALPMFAAGSFGRFSNQQSNIVDYVLVFLFYLATYTVVIFCNAALVAAANIRLNGGDPTVGDGFRIATSRLPKIIAWAVVSATIGMILRWISERGGIVGAIVAGIVGFAWNVVTFLVVPILVIENVGPIEAIKRSSGLLRKTWGEQLVGNFSIGLVFGLVILAVVLVGIAITYVLFQVAVALGIVAVIALVVLVAALALISAAMSGIFTVALYRYASQGNAGAFFDESTIQGAFKAKR
jgi:hypothetical protein